MREVETTSRNPPVGKMCVTNCQNHQKLLSKWCDKIDKIVKTVVSWCVKIVKIIKIVVKNDVFVTQNCVKSDDFSLKIV